MIAAAWRVRALIDQAAFAHNLARVRELAANSQLMAVVKANAYGHDINALLPALTKADSLAVIDVTEAQQLRSAGLTQSITILQGANTQSELDWCLTNNAKVVLCNLQQVKALSETAFAPEFWIKLDTGMHRLGLSPLDLAQAMALLNHAGLSGPYDFMSHFACADNDAAVTQQQMQQFETMLASLPVARRSLANSAALIEYPESHNDTVRPGIMLYGASPFVDRAANQLGLLPVMTLQAKVVAVQQLKQGEALGYGHSWRAQADCQVIVVSAGYGDGVPRNMPQGYELAVADGSASVVGRVSMDSCFAMLPANAAVAVGELVTLWGRHSDERVLAVDELAQACGTIGYELLTRVTARVPRITL